MVTPLTRWLGLLMVLLCLIVCVTGIHTAVAQPAEFNELAGAAAPLGIFTCFCLFNIVFYLLWIIVIVWMYKDAVNRGMDNPWIWIIVGFVAPVVSLIVYLLIRPSR